MVDTEQIIRRMERDQKQVDNSVLPLENWKDSMSGRRLTFFYLNLPGNKHSGDEPEVVFLDIDSGESVKIELKQVKKLIGKGQFEPLHDLKVEIRSDPDEKPFYYDPEAEERNRIDYEEPDEVVVINEADNSSGEQDPSELGKGSSEDKTIEDEDQEVEEEIEPGDLIYG